MIDLISKNIVPLIVGGGIVDLLGINKAHDSGADLVIGTAFERDFDFFDSAKQQLIENK
jgi:putative glycerol-1-phosphate prenyltransferase